jgi:hypothetical protein
VRGEISLMRCAQGVHPDANESLTCSGIGKYAELRIDRKAFDEKADDQMADKNVYHFSIWKRRATSSAFSRELKAETRK